MATVAAPKIHRNRDHAAPGQSGLAPVGVLRGLGNANIKG